MRKLNLPSLLTIIFLSVQAHAYYVCGPNYQTYEVESTTGMSGMGIRCVRNNGKTYTFYGEGYWNSSTEFKYRHVGIIFKYKNNLNHTVEKRAAMSDICGNGESACGTYNGNIKVGFNSQYGSYPNVITLSGAINEKWNKVESSNYIPIVNKRVSTCGPHFNQYKVFSADGVEAIGVRCLMKNKFVGRIVWYGQGEWNGNIYAHTGVFLRRSISGAAYAYDICNYWYDLCLPKRADLKYKRKSGEYVISGRWNEIWKPE